MSTIDDNDLSLSATPDERYGTSSGESVEVSSVNGKAALKSIFAPGNRKRLVVYAVALIILVVAIFISLVGLGSDDDIRTAVGSGTNQGGKMNIQNDRAAPTWVQQQEIERYNNEQLAIIQQEKPTAHPLLEVSDSDLGASKDVDLTVTEEVNPFFVEPEKEAPRTVGRAINNGNNQRNQEPLVDVQAMDSLIESLIESEGARAPKLQQVSWSYIEPIKDDKTPLVDDKIDSQAPQIDQRSSCSVNYARAGDMALGTTNMGLNSDVGGPVSIEVHSGKLRGARLLGQFERADTWIRISLNKLVLRDETISINAIALDTETTLNAVEGDVDRHIMYRYGWWGVGTVLRAIGRAAEITADSEVYVSDGTIVETTSASSERETRIALGELGQDVGDVMRDRLDRPITVSLNVGDEVGIFFMDDVCSQTAGLSVK
ncbi:hypothetical protein LCGC14_0555590 [marine sediment metagenome]|uniref:Bacterial conjugation TrbI-like protein n=1 Tax=marine sediment metagenome TaxID=412755 RepID=A0A0F9UWS1_9ZZZZ